MNKVPSAKVVSFVCYSADCYHWAKKSLRTIAIAPVRPEEALGSYDLIFANILARPLRLLAPSLAAIAAPDAELVLSGLLTRDVPGVLSAYGAQGFALARRRDLEGWVTLLLRRGGAAPRPL